MLIFRSAYIFRSTECMRAAGPLTQIAVSLFALASRKTPISFLGNPRDFILVAGAFI